MPYEVKWTIILTKCYVKTWKVISLANQTSSHYFDFIYSKLISIDCYINDKFYILYQKAILITIIWMELREFPK